MRLHPLSILNVMVPNLWQYLRYWWNKVDVSSILTKLVYNILTRWQATNNGNRVTGKPPSHQVSQWQGPTSQAELPPRTCRLVCIGRCPSQTSLAQSNPDTTTSNPPPPCSSSHGVDGWLHAAESNQPIALCNTIGSLKVNEILYRLTDLYAGL